MKRVSGFIIKILFHIIVWTLIILFPYFFMNLSKPHPPIFENWLNMVFIIIIFYANYIFFIEKFLFTKKYSLYILTNILFLSFFILISIQFKTKTRSIPEKPRQEFFNIEEFDPHKPEEPPFDIEITRIIFPLLISLGAAVAIKSTIKSNLEENKRKKVENEHLKSEIIYLKYQIQPHFFFNTLNNIYSLIDSRPNNAKEVLHRLSKLMRYILYQTNNLEVSLLEEFSFIENYIELMKIRTQQNVSISLEVPSSFPDAQIPPLLYIPLVENAFKHGIDPVKKSIIYLWFSATEDSLHFEITNTNFPKERFDKSGSGIGISNLKKRLDILYPKKNYFFEQKIIAEYFITTLIIPIKNE